MHSLSMYHVLDTVMPMMTLFSMRIMQPIKQRVKRTPIAHADWEWQAAQKSTAMRHKSKERYQLISTHVGRNPRGVYCFIHSFKTILVIYHVLTLGIEWVGNKQPVSALCGVCSLVECWNGLDGWGLGRGVFCRQREQCAHSSLHGYEENSALSGTMKSSSQIRSSIRSWRNMTASPSDRLIGASEVVSGNCTRLQGWPCRERENGD